MKRNRNRRELRWVALHMVNSDKRSPKAQIRLWFRHNIIERPCRRRSHKRLLDHEKDHEPREAHPCSRRCRRLEVWFMRPRSGWKPRGDHNTQVCTTTTDNLWPTQHWWPKCGPSESNAVNSGTQSADSAFLWQKTALARNGLFLD